MNNLFFCNIMYWNALSMTKLCFCLGKIIFLLSSRVELVNSDLFVHQNFSPWIQTLLIWFNFENFCTLSSFINCIFLHPILVIDSFYVYCLAIVSLFAFGWSGAYWGNPPCRMITDVLCKIQLIIKLIPQFNLDTCLSLLP